MTGEAVLELEPRGEAHRAAKAARVVQHAQQRERTALAEAAKHDALRPSPVSIFMCLIFLRPI